MATNLSLFQNLLEQNSRFFNTLVSNGISGLSWIFHFLKTESSIFFQQISSFFEYCSNKTLAFLRSAGSSCKNGTVCEPSILFRTVFLSFGNEPLTFPKIFWNKTAAFLKTLASNGKNGIDRAFRSLKKEIVIFWKDISIFFKTCANKTLSSIRASGSSCKNVAVWSVQSVQQGLFKGRKIVFKFFKSCWNKMFSFFRTLFVNCKKGYVRTWTIFSSFFHRISSFFNLWRLGLNCGALGFSIQLKKNYLLGLKNIFSFFKEESALSSTDRIENKLFYVKTDPSIEGSEQKIPPTSSPIFFSEKVQPISASDPPAAKEELSVVFSASCCEPPPENKKSCMPDSLKNHCLPLEQFCYFRAPSFAVDFLYFKAVEDSLTYAEIVPQTPTYTPVISFVNQTFDWRSWSKRNSYVSIFLPRLDSFFKLDLPLLNSSICSSKRPQLRNFSRTFYPSLWSKRKFDGSGSKRSMEAISKSRRF